MNLAVRKSLSTLKNVYKEEMLLVSCWMLCLDVISGTLQPSYIHDRREPEEHSYFRDGNMERWQERGSLIIPWGH